MDLAMKEILKFIYCGIVTVALYGWHRNLGRGMSDLGRQVSGGNKQSNAALRPRRLPMLERHARRKLCLSRLHGQILVPESEAVTFETIDELVRFEDKVPNPFPAQDLEEHLKCLASPNKCWPQKDEEEAVKEMAASNDTIESKDLEAIEKAIEEFESEAEENFLKFEETEKPVEPSTTIKPPEIYDLDIRNVNPDGSKDSATEHPPLAAVAYDSISDRRQQQLPRKQNKNIEYFQTEDGQELIIEAVESKADKSGGKVDDVPDDTRRPIFRPHPREEVADGWQRPVGRPAMKYNEYPPREWYYWRRPHPQDHRRPPRIDSHNYDVGYHDAYYDPRTGEWSRYRMEESRREHQSRRSWRRPATSDLYSYPQRYQ